MTIARGERSVALGTGPICGLAPQRGAAKSVQGNLSSLERIAKNARKIDPLYFANLRAIRVIAQVQGNAAIRSG
jgi:hypothetical protein